MGQIYASTTCKDQNTLKYITLKTPKPSFRKFQVKKKKNLEFSVSVSFAPYLR